MPGLPAEDEEAYMTKQERVDFGIVTFILTAEVFVCFHFVYILVYLMERSIPGTVWLLKYDLRSLKCFPPP